MGRGHRRACTAALCLLGSAAPAVAQYESAFEPLRYLGSPAGVVLNGQDGWYLPPGFGTSFFCYTYLGNAVGVLGNAAGRLQFVAGTSGAGFPALAQRDTTWGRTLWVVRYDMAVNYDGPTAPMGTIGGFAPQPHHSSAPYMFRGVHTPTGLPQRWEAVYMAFDAAGTPFPEPGVTPDQGWRNLELRKWYRFETRIDFPRNRIVQVRVWPLDPTSPGTPRTHYPREWFLRGGALPPHLPPPEAVSMFATGVGGNVAAFDNLLSTCYADCDTSTGVGTLDIFDFLCFQNAFAAGDPSADCDFETGFAVLDIFDFLCFQNAFAAGCP